MRRYNTSIKSLMEAKNAYQTKRGVAPIFLSDWDSDYNSIQMPNLAYNNARLEDVQKYYFWTDEEGYRDSIQTFLSSHFAHTLSKECFTIGSNGTSSLMLTLTALKEAGKHRALILTPIYFSTLNLLDELDYDVVEYRLSANNNFIVQIDILENTIIKQEVDTLIITNPLFGTGIEIAVDTIRDIAKICNIHDVCLVMDYVYGGMPWKCEKLTYYIFYDPVYQAVSLSEQHIFIESISKRVFLNGAKFALIFSSPSIMKRILRLSVFMVGSMAQQQISLVPQIYSARAVAAIASMISDNAQIAYKRYRKIRTILADSNLILSNANCGYFAMISIPCGSNIDDTTFAIELLRETGVLTTPHSRYLYTENGLYSFRINLLLDQRNLIEGITKLKDLRKCPKSLPW